MRAALRWISRGATALLAALALYGLAALAFAAFPRAGRPIAADAEIVEAFVCANAVHADIVVAPADKWRLLFGDAARPIAEGAFLAIGWGDYGFYHDTPTWADLRPTTLLRALSGAGPTTLHVRAVYRPTEGSPCVGVKMDRAGSDALFGFIAASAVVDQAGRAIPQDQIGPGEAFYQARGRYGPLRTCNVWASEALAAAGQSTAVWAPFSFGVLWPLGRNG